MFPQLVDGVEDVDLGAGTGVVVDIVDHLVHTDEGPSPAHPCTAVDQERSPHLRSASPSLSVEHHLGQLGQLDEVPGVARGGSVRPVRQLEVDDDSVLPSSQPARLGHVQLPHTVVGCLGGREYDGSIFLIPQNPDLSQVVNSVSLKKAYLTQLVFTKLI